MLSYFLLTFLDGTVFTNTTSANVPAGTYYFISEYAIGTTYFNETESGDPAEVEYSTSRLNTAVNALTTSNTYKIVTSDLYSQIVTRNLIGESYPYSSGGIQEQS